MAGNDGRAWRQVRFLLKGGGRKPAIPQVFSPGTPHHQNGYLRKPNFIPQGKKSSTTERKGENIGTAAIGSMERIFQTLAQRRKISEKKGFALRKRQSFGRGRADQSKRKLLVVNYLQPSMGRERREKKTTSLLLKGSQRK